MQNNSGTLLKIARGNLCSGCGACTVVASGAIDMRYSDQGFLRPEQTSKISPEQDARIAEICPGTGLKMTPGEREDHPLWGPVTAVYVGHSTDAALRRNASSGGALSAVLVHLLETGQVDRVLQTAAAPTLPVGNCTVTSVTADQVLSAAGSRYAPSAPLANLKQWLTGDERFAFVGKPCDVAALRGLAERDPQISEHFPVMVSFFCAGVPSLKGAYLVLDEMGVQRSDVIAFRYRGDGWPGCAKATLVDGTTRTMSYADSWGGVLSKHVQLRCKVCPDGTGSFADIVFADAWETDSEGYPLFEEREGESLILSRTEAGKRIVGEAMASGVLETVPLDITGIRPMQPGQVRKRQLTLPRLIALRLAGRPTPDYEGFHLWRNTREAGIRLTTRNFLGMLRRVLLGKVDAP